MILLLVVAGLGGLFVHIHHRNIDLVSLGLAERPIEAEGAGSDESMPRAGSAAMADGNSVGRRPGPSAPGSGNEATSNQPAQQSGDSAAHGKTPGIVSGGTGAEAHDAAPQDTGTSQANREPQSGFGTRPFTSNDAATGAAKLPGPHDSSGGADGASSPDPRRRRAFEESVADARFHFGDRNLAEARRAIAQAKINAQTEAERGQIARLETMAEVLTQFWDGMRNGVARLDAMGELEVEDTRVAIVEASRDHLIIKGAGRIYRWQTEDLPAKMVMAIAHDYFAEDAVSKLLIGAFLAVDPDGDRAWAKRLWREAAHGETGIDVNWLMPEIDAAPPPRASSAGGVSAGPAATPDAEHLKAAEQRFRQQYQAELDAATDAEEKAGLARELLAQAASESGDARFVMLREARKLAAAAGDVALAGRAVDAMSRNYSVDPVALKAEALKIAHDSAQGTSGHRDVAQAALGLVEAAAKDGRLDAARQLADVALEAARESRSPALMKQAAAAGRQIEALRSRR